MSRAKLVLLPERNRFIEMVTAQLAIDCTVIIIASHLLNVSDHFVDQMKRSRFSIKMISELI